MAALAQPVLQEATIREVVASIPLPEGIKLLRIEFRNDSTGDPALFLIYSIDESLKSDDEWIQDLSALTKTTRSRIRDLDETRFPYLRFVAAQ
jgi:hypothetical protein